MSTNKYQSTPTDHQIKKVNNYMFDIADQIGSGYSSRVYKATNCLTAANVAIKVVEFKKLANEVERTLLANQSKALSIMNHPNILKAEHTMQTVNNFYIVMELFQQNLQNLLAIQGPQSQPQIIQFLQTIGSGLAYLQEQGIIHRDIKPSNILISNNRYVLGDFGFCHLTSMPCKEKGFNVGSPFYMSPEAYKNSIYSHKSDIWALGITVLEILVGRKPFSSLHFDAMIKQICENKCYRRFNISEALKQVLDQMLEFDLEKRITPLELLQILSKFPCSERDASTTQAIEARSTSINERQVNFKNNQKRKVSPRRISLTNQQNMYSLIPSNAVRVTGAHPLTQKKLVNFCESSHRKINEDCHHSPPNPKFRALESLSKLMLTDANLSQNPHKLKLLRILAILPQNQFPTSLILSIEQLPVDEYFNHILQSTDSRKFAEVTLYLCFLLNKVISAFQGQNKKHSENQLKLIASLEQALSLWRKSSQQSERSQNSSARIISFTSLQRAKCRSTGHFNSGLCQIAKN